MIMPSIDLMEGRCVKLVGGDRASIAHSFEDPLAILKRWKDEGASRVHVVDLDGASGRDSRANRSIVRRMLEAPGMGIQLGGGIRDEQTLAGFLDAGAEGIVVSTRAVSDEAWLRRMASAYPGRIIVSLDARGNDLMVDGWERASSATVTGLLSGLNRLKLQSVVYTDIAREGRLAGVDRGFLSRLCSESRHGVLLAGGISSEADIAAAQSAGASGVIIGMALYDGRVRLREMVRKYSGSMEDQRRGM